MARGDKGGARENREWGAQKAVEDEYGPEAALAVTARAVQREFPWVSREAVAGYIQVKPLMMSGKVNVSAERRHMEDLVDRAKSEILKDFAKPDGVSSDEDDA